jgi:hypothetical protein
MKGTSALAVAVLVALGLLLAAGGCGKKADGPATERSINLPRVRFTDITTKAGISFRHTNGAFGKKLLPETMGSGVAFIDFDNDGHQDLLFVNSCPWPGHEDKDRTPPTLAFYRNRGDDTFEDITRQVGLDISLYGMGVTVGDFDNDGWDDVFITALGGNRLFRNVPDGKGGRRFEDVTASAGDLAGETGLQVAGDFLEREAPIDFPSSAAFLDFDNDGLLDLFVCYYVTWSPRLDMASGARLRGTNERAYGPPRYFEGTYCRLYRNLGAGKFKDVSERAGIRVHDEHGRAAAKALGVIVADIDGDGWPDIVVANDTVRNFFFRNQHDGTFKEIGLQAGIAYPVDGSPRGAMGIDWAEFRPGQYALAIGNFANEPISLLRLDQPGKLLFSDVAGREGLAGPNRDLLKFGLFFFDFDLDGFADLLLCNGHLEPDIQKIQPAQSYRQPVQLFWNTSGEKERQPCFAPMTRVQCGPDLFRPLVGRGCAFADVDGNGTLDVVLTENGGPARLLRNEGHAGNHWIRLVLKGNGKRSNRSAIGARVALFTADGRVQHREVTSARGYLSQSELPLTFGLGAAERVERVEIRWPGLPDQPQILREGLEVNHTHRIDQP